MYPNNMYSGLNVVPMQVLLGPKYLLSGYMDPWGYMIQTSQEIRGFNAFKVYATSREISRVLFMVLMEFQHDVSGVVGLQRLGVTMDYSL